jgi:murein DD-endopeptidase MepM/ murein hydrolase activator NlpD
MSLYRLPFPSEVASTWDSGGNWDLGGGHGPGDPNDNADGQAYAYDIGHATGGKVLAARAGVVIWCYNDCPDNTNPPPPDPGNGAGNFIWIRHVDNTVSVYLHLKFHSLRVVEGQWVPQGFWLANSGNTGNSSAPHLHFEVRTALEKDVFSLPSFGTSLLIHFESKTAQMFRPGAGEILSGKSNNVEGDFRQDGWRQCGKCQVLYFEPNGGSTCPVGGEHSPDGTFNYTLSVDAISPQGQIHWRYCTKCHGLFFGDNGGNRCPKGPGLSHTAGGSNYALLSASSGSPGESGWRWCQNCSILWRNDGPSKCPATGGAHTTTESGNYLLHVTNQDWQRDWRACGKCGCVFYGPHIGISKCVGNGGGAHVISNANISYTPNYFFQGAPQDGPGQEGWAYCDKCTCLWMGLNSGSVCHASGNHSKIVSGNYTVIEHEGPAVGQSGWRWCNKCQSLWFSPLGSTMKCPAGGSHNQTGGSYWVQFFGHP